MKKHLPDPVRACLATVAYRTLPGAAVRRLKRAARAPEVHRKPGYWNGELSGRMSTPNLNGRVGNAVRDLVTAELIHQCGPRPRAVLDVGCAFCDLAHVLDRYGLERYVAVDLSDYVIDRAWREHSSWPVADRVEMSFHAADLREFTPSGVGAPEQPDVFDVIVFNEVLQFIEVDEVPIQLRRYSQWLAPDGIFCVMLSHSPKGNAIFRSLHRHFSWVYGMVLQQNPDAPKYHLTRNRATPPFQLGVLRP
jgi:SAM-dependent methyltransferase